MKDPRYSPSEVQLPLVFHTELRWCPLFDRRHVLESHQEGKPTAATSCVAPRHVLCQYWCGAEGREKLTQKLGSAQPSRRQEPVSLHIAPKLGWRERSERECVRLAEGGQGSVPSLAWQCSQPRRRPPRTLPPAAPLTQAHRTGPSGASPSTPAHGGARWDVRIVSLQYMKSIQPKRSWE